MGHLFFMRRFLPEEEAEEDEEEEEGLKEKVETLKMAPPLSISPLSLSLDDSLCLKSFLHRHIHTYRMHTDDTHMKVPTTPKCL